MMESIRAITWQEWIIAYFVVGVVVMSVLARFKASKRKTFANELWFLTRNLEDENKPPTQRFLETRLMPGLAFLFGWLVWPVMLIIRLWVAYRGSSDAQPWPPKRQWDLGPNADELLKEAKELIKTPYERSVLLEERLEEVNADEIEQRHFVQDPLDAVPALPFGHLNRVWLHLRDQLTPERSLWRFRCERVGLHKDYVAYEGYAVFDGNTYVDHMVSGFVWPQAVLAHEPVVAQRQ